MADYYVDEYGNITTKKKKKKADYTVDENGKFTSNNVKTSYYDPEKGGNKNSVFKSGGFSDGVDGVGDFFVDLGQTILGTAGDIVVNAAAGVGRMVEGVTDLATYGVAGVADLFGADDFADKTKNFAKKSQTDAFLGNLEGYVDQYSVLGNKADVVAEGLGQVGAIILTGGAASAAGLSTAGVSAVTAGTMFASGMGSGMSDAYSMGASDGQAVGYGVATGTIEAVSELIFGGLGKGFKAVGVSKGLTSIDDVFAKKVSKTAAKFITSEAGQKIVGNTLEYAVKSGAEGLEEVISGFGTAIAKDAILLNGKDEKAFHKILEDENLLEQFVVGSIVSGIAQGGDYVKSIKNGRDFVTGLSANEQKVVDAVYEQRLAEESEKRTLSKSDKNKLYERVIEEMKRGYVSTDDIESILGGETYKKYKNLTEQEASLKSKKKAIETEIKKLLKTPEAQFTVEQREKLNSLRAELKGIKKQIKGLDTKTAKSYLFNEVNKLTEKDTFLRESYNDLIRQTEDIQIDGTQYKGTKFEDAAKKTIENARKAKASNSVRVRDFVEFAAKYSSVSGKVVDFGNDTQVRAILENQLKAQISAETDTAKIAELEDMLKQVQEGTTHVNGVKTKDGVIINIESSNYLNTVLGHEVTHFLENTDAYEKLQKAVFKYAQRKGDYDGRRKILDVLYKNVDGTTVDAELTADLVGDYLFTDYDFVKSLSTEHRNIFQKIYDQIKYMFKLATAGSKEARELEKVMHNFEKALRESVETSQNAEHNEATTQFSLRTKPAPKKTKEVYKLMRLKDGEIYPLFIDSTEPLKIGEWYDADSPNLDFLKEMPSGIFLVDTNNGTYQSFDDYLKESGERKTKYPSKKAIEKATAEGKRWVYIEDTAKAQKRFGGETRKYWNIGINGSGSVSTFSMRPGYHAGSLPTMRQIGKGSNKDLRDDSFVWTVGEVPADIDYQAEAEMNPDKDIPTHIPEDGYYLKATNADKAKSQADRVGWYVAGSYKINRIISDSEARQVIDDWNEAHPDTPVEYDYDRESGMDFDAEQMKLVPRGETKYSLSTDSKGNQLSPAVQKRFEKSKAVDENGNLKVLYHGTASGEFYTFDKSKGNVEGDFGSGFYFTDNESDVENNYEGGGADFDIKVDRRAEQIADEEGIEYSEAEARAREELYKGSFKHEVYLNIENPAIVGETILFDYESYAAEYDPDDYDSEEDYQGDVEQLISDDIDQIIWDIERNIDVYKMDGVAEVLWNAVNEGGIGIEQLKAKINDLYLEDSTTGELVGNEVTRQIIESLGYDGIIDNTVSTKFNMGLEEGTTHYIVFKPNQIKAISNQNPTDNPDIRYSLSKSPLDNGNDLVYNGNDDLSRGEGYARTFEFRKLQAESQGMSDEDIQLYWAGSKQIDEGLRGRFSRSVKSIFLESQNNGVSYDKGLLKLTAKNNNFDMHEGVPGSLFHDVFEMARKYLKYGELVDLHDIKTTEDGIGYDDCYNYLSEDGLSGFSITPDGDLISVFNASGKSGFLRAIAPIVKGRTKTLDCFASENQNLMGMYSAIFGFKAASVMDYSMEFDHDNIAANHNMPQVAFMVNTDSEVETKYFTETEYDEAVAYRNSFVNQATDNDIAPTQPSLSEDPAKADADYVFAVENGDTETAQRMVEEAAKKAGYSRKLFHGTASKFNVFGFGRAGIFTTDNYDMAKTYGDNVMSLYGKEGAKVLTIDAQESPHYAIRVSKDVLDFSEYPLMRGKELYSTNDISLIAFREGYDVVVINNVYDNFSAVSGNKENGLGTDIVYKDSNQVKSAEAVTYDDNGDIIPLSERFDSSKDDIRYSLSYEGENRTLGGSYRFSGKDFRVKPKNDIAPVADTAPTLEDIAPLPDEQLDYGTYEAIRPKPEKQPSLKKIDNAGSEERVAQVLVDEPVTEKKKGGIFSKFVSNFVDKGAAVENLSLKTKNRALQDKYKTIGRSETKAQYFMENGTKGVKALADIIAEVESTGKTREFYEYLYHKHNVDRMSLESKELPNLLRLESKMNELGLLNLNENQLRAIASEKIDKETSPKRAELIKTVREYLASKEVKNKPVFGYSVTADMSQAIASEFENTNPEFKVFAQDVYSFMKHLRNMMVDGGIISQETADLWAEMYPYYVPIRRDGKDGLAVNVPLDTNKTGVNAPIKRATGGDSDILPLFNTMARMAIQTFKAVDRNSFGIELKNTLGGVVESAKTSLDEVIDSIDAHESLLQEGKNGSNPTFTVFENGKRVTFEITEELYDALKPTSEGLAYTNKVANAVSNFHRGLLTEYNPVFMATNAIKDIQDVLINSQHPAQTYANIPVAIRELLSHGEWYTEYMENGGGDNTYFDKKTNTITKEKSTLRRIVGFPLDKISEANNFIERLPRLAEYIASRKNGSTVEAAMLDAARITTDFSAGGDVTKFLNRNGATFLNASVQGFAQHVRNVREAKANGLKGWLGLATKVTLAGLPAMLLNGLLWDDDEEYEELSDYVKENYYVVAKYGDGKFVRIPKGRASAVIQNAFEQVGNALTGDDEVDFNQFFELVMSNLAPNNPLDNNIIAPIKQVIENKTWYGEDLVPTRLQDLPAAEQYDESTDSISKWLGEKTGFSPYKINYLLNQYSGGIGDVVLPMLTPEAEGGDDSFGGNLLAPVRDKFTTDSVMNNQNVSDFYDTKDKLTVNANASGATVEDILKSKYMNAINSELSELYKQKREIQNSDLSDGVKYSRVREIQKQINELAKESLGAYGDVTVSGNYASVGDKHYRLTESGWSRIDDEQFQKNEPFAKVYGGYDSFLTYSSELNDISADKDENGKSINGSRKEKVINYINGLDADYETKIILFKSEYPADDTYNKEIIEYLNNREDLTYEERVAIFTSLGFTVSNGYVYWD